MSPGPRRFNGSTDRQRSVLTKSGSDIAAEFLRKFMADVLVIDAKMRGAVYIIINVMPPIYFGIGIVDLLCHGYGVGLSTREGLRMR